MTRRSISLAVTLGLLLTAVAPGQNDDVLLRAEELIGAGDAQGAIEILDPALAAREKWPQAHLLRSTARFMLGERERAVSDLNEALRLDPTLRQGWLNRGAVALSERRYPEAHAAFETARELDSSAADNDLNLGVSLMFLGRIDEATARFVDYVARHEQPAQALVLVSKNYALGGYKELSLNSLERAITLDERQRLGAKTDPAYEVLLGSVRFQRLLSTDSFVPAQGSRLATRAFEATYEGGKGPLLSAVLDALGKLGIPFDPRVEVTPDWALLWADMRIKVQPGERGRGVVELSAPPGRFASGDWQARVEHLSEQIQYQLTPRSPR